MNDSFPEEGLAANDAGKAGALLAAKRKAGNNDWNGALAKLQVD